MDVESHATIVSWANDKSIVIKPANKCGSIVIMNQKEYETAALSQLTNKHYYEEIQEDPNSRYKEEIS